MLLRGLLAAGLVDTIEVGVSPLLLAKPGVPMLAPLPPLPHPVRLRLTWHDALPSGILILEYAVHSAAAKST